MLRKLLSLMIVVGLLATAGCMPQSLFGKKKKEVDPYERVVVGLNERQVVAILGDPGRRQRVTEGEVEQGKTMLIYRWIQPNHIVKVFFVEGLVVGKERT